MKNPYTPTSEQETLYKKHILPNEEELFSVISEVRRDLDEIYEEKKSLAPKTKQYPGIQDIHKYPRGHCYEIAVRVREWLLEIAPDFFNNFLKDGGICERNWWFFVPRDWSRIFHNTIQVGTRIYDVCHEEPSGTEKQIHITHISDPRYRVIDNFADYAETREWYPHFKGYSLEWVLHVAFSPVIPLIFEASDGRLIIGDEQVIVKRNVDTHFQFGKDFLRHWLQKYPHLPDHVRKNLLYCFEKNRDYTHWIEKRGVIENGLRVMQDENSHFSHSNVREWIKKWHQFDKRFSDHFKDIYHGSGVAITLFRRVLKTYNSLLVQGKLPYSQEKNWQN